MKRIDTINVIPFIDIMLVLLAIILTTATFIVEGRLDIDLPSAESRAAAPVGDPLQIAVDREGRLFFSARPIMLAGLADKLDAVAPTTPIRLRVDTEARFGRFVAVIDLLKARGLDKVSITTRKQ